MVRERRLPLGTATAGLFVAAYLAYRLRDALVPFALSFALAYLANPLLNLFEARGLRRDRIVVGFYLIIAVGISATAGFLLPTATRELALLQSQAPSYFTKTKELLTHLQGEIARRLPVGSGLVEHWSLQMYDPLWVHFEMLPGYLLGLFPLLSLIFLVPFITFYFLMDSSRWIRQAIENCPSRWVEQALHLATELDTSMGNYVRGVLIEMLCVAIASFLGLLALGVNYALGIAVLAGIVSVVPYAGPVLGGGAAILVALFQFKNALAVSKVLALFLGIRLADDWILQPFLSTHSVRLHPVVYLLALMVGGKAFGFTGLLLGVPAAAMMKSMLQVAWDWYSTEFLLRVDAPAGLRIPYV